MFLRPNFNILNMNMVQSVVNRVTSSKFEVILGVIERDQNMTLNTQIYPNQKFSAKIEAILKVIERDQNMTIFPDPCPTLFLWGHSSITFFTAPSPLQGHNVILECPLILKFAFPNICQRLSGLSVKILIYFFSKQVGNQNNLSTTTNNNKYWITSIPISSAFMN